MNETINTTGNNNKYFKKVFNLFFLALLLTLVGMIIGKLFIPPAFAVLFSIVTLVLLIFVFVLRLFSKKNNGKYNIPLWVVYTVSFLIGISIYPIIDIYVSNGSADLVFMALGITVLLFFSLALYAYKSKRDFSFLGPFLFVALIALVLVSIFGIFTGSAVLHLVIAYFGIVIFSGYVVYDISRIKFSDFTDEDVPGAVLDLYLDFINLFLYILRVVRSWTNI